MMWFSTLYTIFSIIWYSVKGMFIKTFKVFFVGETKVHQLTNGNKKAILLFHGVSGTGDSGYIKYVAHKLKNKYDLFAPDYGSSDSHLYATYLPTEIDPIYTRDVLALYNNIKQKYDQVSIIGFSAGGAAALQFLKQLKDDDIKILSSTFFVSPAFKLKEGFLHLEKVLFLVRWIMKFDFWKKHFLRINRKQGFLTAVKFWFSCRTFEDVFSYFVNPPTYPILNPNPIDELNTKFVLLHPDDDPIVQMEQTLSFMGFRNYTRINQLTGGHVGFNSLDRCVKFYENEENILVDEIWDPTKLIPDQ